MLKFCLWKFNANKTAKTWLRASCNNYTSNGQVSIYFMPNLAKEKDIDLQFLGASVQCEINLRVHHKIN